MTVGPHTAPVAPCQVVWAICGLRFRASWSPQLRFSFEDRSRRMSAKFLRGNRTRGNRPERFGEVFGSLRGRPASKTALGWGAPRRPPQWRIGRTMHLSEVSRQPLGDCLGAPLRAVHAQNCWHSSRQFSAYGGDQLIVFPFEISTSWVVVCQPL